MAKNRCGSLQPLALVFLRASEDGPFGTLLGPDLVRVCHQGLRAVDSLYRSVIGETVSKSSLSATGLLIATTPLRGGLSAKAQRRLPLGELPRTELLEKLLVAMQARAAQQAVTLSKDSSHGDSQVPPGAPGLDEFRLLLPHLDDVNLALSRIQATIQLILIKANGGRLCLDLPASAALRPQRAAKSIGVRPGPKGLLNGMYGGKKKNLIVDSTMSFTPYPGDSYKVGDRVDFSGEDFIEVGKPIRHFARQKRITGS